MEPPARKKIERTDRATVNGLASKLIIIILQLVKDSAMKQQYTDVVYYSTEVEWDTPLKIATFFRSYLEVYIHTK